MTYQVTVIVPALNEEKNIEAAIFDVIASYEKLGLRGEIVVVNDGSTDRTVQVVEGLMKSYPFIRMIHHNQPQGIGASFWEGVRAARGELVTYMPGDAESISYEALRYFPLFEHVDIVVPFIFNRGVRDWRRRFASKVYKAVINFTFGTLLNYMNGAVIYRKCVLDELQMKSRGFFFQVELLMQAIRLGYLYAEVPSALSRRLSGKSKAFTFRSFFCVCGDFLRTALMIYVLPREKKSFHPGSVTGRRWAERAQS